MGSVVRVNRRFLSRYLALVFCAVMQIHIPDPAYTGSERARANFRLAVKIALGFVALVYPVVELGAHLARVSGSRRARWPGCPAFFSPL